MLLKQDEERKDVPKDDDTKMKETRLNICWGHCNLFYLFLCDSLKQDEKDSTLLQDTGITDYAVCVMCLLTTAALPDYFHEEEEEKKDPQKNA